MSESIHGHEVMQIMIEAKQPFTKESLKEFMGQKFGPDARFHTCSAEHMTATELIEFLDKRGKFVDGPNGFSTDPDKICHHE